MTKHLLLIATLIGCRVPSGTATGGVAVYAVVDSVFEVTIPAKVKGEPDGGRVAARVTATGPSEPELEDYLVQGTRVYEFRADEKVAGELRRALQRHVVLTVSGGKIINVSVEGEPPKK